MHICTATTVLLHVFQVRQLRLLSLQLLVVLLSSPNVFLFPSLQPSTSHDIAGGRTMWWCIFATPAMRLAPPIMQLRQADALSAGTGLAAGRAAPMMAVEQQGHSAAF